jgi:hypothetical protein
MSIYYKIKSDPYTFAAIIFKEHEQLTRFYFGGKEKCVFISIYKDDDMANLDTIGHGYNCALDGDLPRGEGTIKLLKSALKFLLYMFPSITSISLLDKSNIECARNTKMYLAYIYLAVYGKTWYQKHFDAIVETKVPTVKLFYVII